MSCAHRLFPARSDRPRAPRHVCFVLSVCRHADQHKGRRMPPHAWCRAALALHRIFFHPARRRPVAAARRRAFRLPWRCRRPIAGAAWRWPDRWRWRKTWRRAARPCWRTLCRRDWPPVSLQFPAPSSLHWSFRRYRAGCRAWRQSPIAARGNSATPACQPRPPSPPTRQYSECCRTCATNP